MLSDIFFIYLFFLCLHAFSVSVSVSKCELPFFSLGLAILTTAYVASLGSATLESTDTET